MAADVEALIRVRVLRRDGYRCQRRGCTARAHEVGFLPDGRFDRYVQALCSAHMASPVSAPDTSVHEMTP